MESWKAGRDELRQSRGSRVEGQIDCGTRNRERSLRSREVTPELKRTSHLKKWASNLELQSKSSLWRPPHLVAFRATRLAVVDLGRILHSYSTTRDHVRKTNTLAPPRSWTEDI